MQDWGLQISDHEQDGRSYENTHSKNSHPEARFAEEDDELEIVSGTDGTVRLLAILKLLHILLLSPILLILATYENCINIREKRLMTELKETNKQSVAIY